MRRICNEIRQNHILARLKGGLYHSVNLRTFKLGRIELGVSPCADDSPDVLAVGPEGEGVGVDKPVVAAAAAKRKRGSG